jgi:hypothetical protein
MLHLECEDFVHSELLSFWTLSIVQYSENTKEHSISET